MSRKTSFTLEQILSMLKEGEEKGIGFAGCHGQGKCPTLPNGQHIGFILNEIGLIFLEEGEESREAEKELLAMLNGNDATLQGMAYYFLSRGKNSIDDESLEAIRAFETEPENAMTVQGVKNKLAALAA